MLLQMKQLIKNPDYKKIIVKFLIATASACLSSMSFFIIGILDLIDKTETAGNIVGGMTFWLFLILEIALYIIVLNNIKKIDVKIIENKERKKLFHIDLILFVISLIAVIIIRLAFADSGMVFAMLFVSICLFTFQMLFVINSKMFKKIISLERKHSNETN